LKNEGLPTYYLLIHYVIAFLENQWWR